MSTMIDNIIEIMNVLPIEDQELLYCMAKKLIKAWDPDFTKLTPLEANELNQIIEDDDFVSENDIDWN